MMGGMLDRGIMEQWAGERFEVIPGYLNTATLGLTTQASLEALRQRMAEWQAGT